MSKKTGNTKDPISKMTYSQLCKDNYPYARDVYNILQNYMERLNDNYLNQQNSYLNFLSTFIVSLIGSAIYFFFANGVGKEVGLYYLTPLLISFLSIILLRLLLIYESVNVIRKTNNHVSKFIKNEETVDVVFNNIRNPSIKFYLNIIFILSYVVHIFLFLPILMISAKIILNLDPSGCLFIIILLIEVLISIVFFVTMDRNLLSTK